MNVSENKNLNKIAKTSGILYLMLIPLGFFGILYVPSVLIVQGDIAATVANIFNNLLIFRLSILVAFITQIVNIFLVLSLYKLLQSVNHNYAVLMVIFNLLAIPIAMLNELNHIVLLTSITDSNDALSLASLFLELHEKGIVIAQIFWGLWLFPMGWLIYNSNFLPKFIGVLLAIGGFGYIIDVIIIFALPAQEIVLSQFTFIGEIVLPLWLLIKGIKFNGLQQQLN